MKYALLALLFLFAIPARPAVPEEAPEVVARGFAALVKNGTRAAVDAWLVGSVHETDDRLEDEAVVRMNACLNTMGRAIGFETVRTVPVTPSTRRVYAAAKFERGVGWMYFDCYHAGETWIVCRFAFHTNASVILPPELLAGSGR